QEWRQETDDCVLGAIEENARSQCLLDNRTRGNIKLQALNESSATHFLHCSIFPSHFLELLVQVSSSRIDVLQKLLLFKDREIFKRHAAGERAAAESGSVLSDRDCRGKFFARQERAERQACRNGLRDGNDVGLHAETLVSEYRSGASQTALDFVKDQSRM